MHEKFTGLEILFRLCYGFYGYGFMFLVVVLTHKYRQKIL
jgi:hypothetical protein